MVCGPLTLVILSTAGLSGHQYVERWGALEIDDERERGAQGHWGKGQSLLPGVWFAGWPLMPSSEKVIELRGEGCCSPEFSSGFQS